MYEVKKHLEQKKKVKSIKTFDTLTLIQKIHTHIHRERKKTKCNNTAKATYQPKKLNRKSKNKK